MDAKTNIAPKQKRSIATKNKIKAAARKLFAEEGYYTVTSNNIAKAAQVPIGSFYNYFGNKKGLLLELIKDFNAQFHQEGIDPSRKLIPQLASQEKVQEYIALMLEQSIASSVLADPFYSIIHALQFTEPDVLALSESVREVEIAFMVQLLEQIHQFHPIQDIPIKAKLLHSSAENVALYMHHLGTEFEKQTLIQETAKMFYAYLFNQID